MIFQKSQIFMCGLFVSFLGTTFCIDQSDLTRGMKILSEQGDALSKFHYYFILNEKLSLEKAKSRELLIQLIKDSLKRGCWQCAAYFSYLSVDDSVSYMYAAIAVELHEISESNLNYAKRLWGALKEEWHYQSTEKIRNEIHQLALYGHAAGSSSIQAAEIRMKKEIEKEDSENILWIYKEVESLYSLSLQYLSSRITELEENASKLELDTGLSLANIWIKHHGL